MKNTIITAALLIAATSVSANEQVNSFSGKTFTSNFASGDINLNFINNNDVVLNTECHDVKGKYQVFKKEDNTYKIDFALQEYVNVIPECKSNPYSKGMAKVALNTLNNNQSIEVKVDNQLNTNVIMYSDQGSIFSYNKISTN